MRKNHVVVLAVIVVVVGLASVATYLVHNRAERQKANEAAHTLFGDPGASPYTDSTGNTISLESYLGSILVVNSWASWSPFSTQELQDLNQIAGDYTDRGVRVIAINRKETTDQAQRFLDTLPPLSNLRVVIDTADYFYGAIGGYAMPETIMYNKAGTIILHRQGAMTKEDMQTAIQGIIDSGK